MAISPIIFECNLKHNFKLYNLKLYFLFIKISISIDIIYNYICVKINIMAVMKLGALITDLAGSIGGSTVRRSPAGLTIFNKSRGRSKSSNLSNKGIQRMQSIIQGWSQLSDAERLQWQAAASKFQRKNKFGDLVNYTGRQFYVAHRNAIFDTNIPLQNPGTIRQVVDLPIIQNVQFTPNLVFSVSVNNPIVGGYICVQVQPKVTAASKSVLKRYETLGKIKMSVSRTYDFEPFVNQKFWFKNSRSGIYVYVYYINKNGWRGKTSVFNISF